MSDHGTTAQEEILTQLQQGIAAKKCWSCGCYRGLVTAVEQSLPEAERSEDLKTALGRAHELMQPVRYDCLGCDVCYPALATDALVEIGGESAAALTSCPTDDVAPREGWPPLPGSYTPLRYGAPVAVCTLTDDALAAELTRHADPAVGIVGTLQTENLGIERVIQNVLANPNIRFLVVCGGDSRRAVGHLPGQALIALSANGVDDNRRIKGATGKRPVLRNLDSEDIEHFRRTVEVVDLINTTDPAVILEAVHACADRKPGMAAPFASARTVPTIRGYVPERMTPDPAGYFVIYPDRERYTLLLEHYLNTGVLSAVIEGTTATELYIPAIERGLITRLDHAAYLGRELARAEVSLRSSEAFAQDAAPELMVMQNGAACGCPSNDSDGKT